MRVVDSPASPTGSGAVATEGKRIRSVSVMVPPGKLELTGRVENAPSAFTMGNWLLSPNAAAEEMVLLVTRPNTVNPPFWLSRLSELGPRLTNHPLVALSESPPSFAIEMVA